MNTWSYDKRIKHIFSTFGKSMQNSLIESFMEHTVLAHSQ